MAPIVIVEDEEAVARVVAHFLRQAGHVPVVAATGAAALQAADAGPDLLLLDLGLPDLAGAEVLRRLKRNPATAPIPVVIVSGESDAAALVRGSGAHAVAAILRKPVRCQEVCAVVDAVLHTHAGSVVAADCEAPPARAALRERLLTEGSNTLVRQVCLRVAADHPWRTGPLAVPVASWSEVARAGRQEGLLSAEEAALLAVPAAARVGAL